MRRRGRGQDARHRGEHGAAGPAGAAPGLGRRAGRLAPGRSFTADGFGVTAKCKRYLLPLMVDCERGLGRHSRALELAATPEARTLTEDDATAAKLAAVENAATAVGARLR